MIVYESDLEGKDFERVEYARPAGRLHWAETNPYVVETAFGVKTYYDSVDAIVEDIFVNPRGFDDFDRADEILKVELITTYKMYGSMRMSNEEALLVTWTYGEPVLDENDNETDEIVKYTSIVNYERTDIEVGTIV